ncbi:MAG: DUF167 domain-containing protein [Fimbriimonadaceae bacterium]
MRLSVRVQPRSTQSKIAVSDGVVKVWVTASPTDGQANAAVCELVAKALGVPKTSVEVVKGQTSRTKVLSVPLGEDEDVLGRLSKALG